jgi:2-polyprenyl-3-methyl-5-hydroxy-6-metoxy-1,4-benzoquinol methylase
MYVDISETAFYINNLYHCNSKYANKGFWEKEYQDDVSQYDWYVRYEEIAPIIKKFIHNNDNILQIGAGNSTLSEQLYMENYKQITNIDISSEVVSQMIEYYKEKNLNIKFFEMNMLNMTLPENCYDIVLDKAGSDVLLVGKKPFKTYRKFMIEIERVLKKDGKFIFITLITVSIYSYTFPSAGFLVMGNESVGIRPNLLPYFTDSISIPRIGMAESLNVAISTGIILDNFRRN